MKRKNIVQFIVLPLLLVIAASAWYIYKEYNRTHKDTASLKPDYSLQASELIKEFGDNEQASNKKYWDKVIEVYGAVKEISHDEKGIYTIVLGDTAAMSSVRCSIDSTHSTEAVTVLKGNTITVKGICTGFNDDELLGSDVILVRCIVDSPKTISNN
jgi:DNA polymerase II small subunit/DNA polymerase delta subunit B